MTVEAPLPLSWELYIDGAANQKGSGVKIFIVPLESITIEKSLKLTFSTTNNRDGYEALWAGLEAVKKLGGKVVKAFSDLKLIVVQVLGEFKENVVSRSG